jgi:hypothetical protein
MALELVPQPNLDHYELTRHFNVSCPPKFGEFWIPAGFHCDGASIPALAWQMTYSPFAPDVMRAAVVHDWLYHAHEDDDGDDRRRHADDVFYEILTQDGVSKLKREVMWAAVRNFGGSYWENDDQAKQLVRELYLRHKEDPNLVKFGFPSWALYRG